MSQQPLFQRVLVANRGEIAIRVMRTCHELGIDTVAVYSQVDAAAPHVGYARQAFGVGPAAAAESYLHIPRLLQAARLSEADAVHPGYGFLSESPEFAEAVQQAGLTWIGPPPQAMRLLGNKTEARDMAIRLDIPVVPGSPGAVETLEQARQEAEKIGYPVLLKAAGGGGGKGMRVVTVPGELESAFRGARSEARTAFGQEAILVERYLPSARHVEIQFLADTHGTCLWLGERECSVQRRHQKILEETPSPALSEDLRRRMGTCAVRLAVAGGYENAGTAEFLLQGEEFFFLEVNARLQVEHPVTEMVLGRDLVADQLRVASGRPIGITQQEVCPRGAAVEVRIYAEDPDNNFYPSPGTIQVIEPPAGPGIRHDSGVAIGSQVTLHYDPLMAKLIAWAPDRITAIRRLHRALEEYQVTGVVTVLPFLREILCYEPFVSGCYDTGIVPRMMEERRRRLEEPAGAGRAGQEDHHAFFAAVAACLYHLQRPARFADGQQLEPPSGWRDRRGQQGEYPWIP